MLDARSFTKLQFANGKWQVANMVRKHRDINPDGFAIYTLYAIYLRCDMCLWHEKSKDLYHIALSVAKYIAFCVTKYIAQARLYIAIVKSPEASQGANNLLIE